MQPDGGIQPLVMSYLTMRKCVGAIAEIITYRVSGFVISIGVALFYPMTKVGGESLFVLEAVMLVAFGVAWFIKGTTLRFPARAANLGVDGEAEVDAAVARVGPA